MTADVCLLLEGTYPYVTGGVSSWVHRIVTGLPELTFALVHIGAQPDPEAVPLYELPPNVVSLTPGWLAGPQGRRHPRASRRLSAAFLEFAATVRSGTGDGLAALAAAVDELQRNPLVVEDLLTGRASWRALRATYLREAPDESFVDWFWHWVSIFRPLLHALATPVPAARCYHAASTGYAGLLAAVASERQRAPLLLTEHGIYTKERRIEIHAAEWIRDPRGGDVLPAEQAPFFRRLWNHQFENISRICYGRATRIVTLFEGNRHEQLQGGADAARTTIVPNGIDLDTYAAAATRQQKRLQSMPFTVAFAGRVAPIKDLRTFLSAMRLVAREVEGLVVRILGPTEDDHHYADECAEYVRQLGLGDVVRFEGTVDLTHHLGDVDVLVLTSISEAQPLVVLEAGAVSLPVVCTDVGACSELVNGSSPEDRRLGPGGIVTPIASPGATANAVLDLWRDPQRRRRLGESMYQRVRRHYDAGAMLRAYRALYTDAMNAHCEPVAREV